MLDDLDTILDELKTRIDIVDVVSDTVSLRRAGPSRYVGLCPFHAERDGSLSVHRKRQFFYCFGCQTGGDVVTWVRELHGASFWQALRRLADRVGMELPEPIHNRREPIPRFEMTGLPAAYRSHPYVLLVEQHAELENVSSPYIRLGESLLTAREALRLEKLHDRACLVYEDIDNALQSVRNVYTACDQLSLYLRPVPEGDTARQLVFKEWPDELWRQSRPGMLVLIRHELRHLGWIKGVASIISIRNDALWQDVMHKACLEQAGVIPVEPEKSEIKEEHVLKLSPEAGLTDVDEDLEQEPVDDTVSSTLWDEDAVVDTGLDTPLVIEAPGTGQGVKEEDPARQSTSQSVPSSCESAVRTPG